MKEIIISPEYLLANLLLITKKNNKNYVTVGELEEYTEEVKKSLLNNNIMGILLPLEKAIVFNSYFSKGREEETNMTIYFVKHNIAYDDIASRFTNYLPQEILSILANPKMGVPSEVPSRGHMLKHRPPFIETSPKNQG